MYSVRVKTITPSAANFIMSGHYCDQGTIVEGNQLKMFLKPEIEKVLVNSMSIGKAVDHSRVRHLS